MELYASDMFFRGDNEKQQAYDCCIHGKIVFKIGDKLLSDDTEWCVSASAYRFLHTLFENHFVGAEEFMVPCCGHFMIPSEDKLSVSISGCSNGIDFNIIHEDEIITVATADNAEYHIPFEEYKRAVISFAKQVMDFYKATPPVNLKTILIRMDIVLLSPSGIRYITKQFQLRMIFRKSLPLLLKIMMLAPKMKLPVFAKRESH